MTFRHDLRRIQTREALLTFLEIDDGALNAILDFSPPPGAPGDDAQGPCVLGAPFFRHEIPKKNGARGHRTVWEAATGFDLAYKALARRLDSFLRGQMAGYPHDSAYGYRVGRNIRENAAAHAGRKHLLVVDITDFFGSISTDRVQALFRDLGLNEEIAGLLALVVTIDGAVAAGLATSPPLSNAIAMPLDAALKALSDAVGATYTRYADDLSFSGDGDLPDIQDIRRVLKAHGFRVADAKTRRSRIGQAHFVTGLSISDPLRPHVPRRKKRRLRQELHYAAKFGLDDHFHRTGVRDGTRAQLEVNRLDGLIKFVSHHEPTLTTPLKTRWREILEASGHGPSFEPRNQHRPAFHIHVDEAEYVRDGGMVLALGMSASQHQARLDEDSRRALEGATSDLYGAGKVDVIRAKGLHFADASPDLRLDYARRLAGLPFEGYVAFDRCDDPSDYETVYVRLLNAMIKRRLMAAESQAARIVFEKNDKVSERAVRACVAAAFGDLMRRNDRCPKAFEIRFVSKPDLGVAVPDFLLGVLGKYLQTAAAPPGRPPTRDHLMFERLRDKYRLILDVSQGVEFSRRHPIQPWV